MAGHYTINYVDANGEKHLMTKRGYVCFIMNLRPESIHKAVIYKCEGCGKWHIGHHQGKPLDDIERAKIAKQYRKWRIVNNY